MSRINESNISNNFSTLKPEQQQVYKDFLASNNIGNFVLLTQPDSAKFSSENDKKRHKIARYSILAAIGITVAGAILSQKFLPEKFKEKVRNFVSYKFNNWLERLDPKIRTKGERVLNNIKKGAEKLNVLNNFTTLKDVYAKECVYKHVKPLAWLDRKSSGFYRKTAIEMVAKKFDRMFKLFGASDSAITKALGKIDPSKLNEVVEVDGVSKTIREFAADAAELIQKRKSSLSASFGSEAQQKTVSRIDKIFENTAPKFREEFNRTVLKEKKYDKFFTFMIRDMNAAEKEKLAQELNKKLTTITGDSSQGFNEQLTKILDVILDKKTNDEEIRPLMEMAANKLKNAVEVQGNDFFDKVRDINAGCAPTDIIFTLFSAGGLGLYMSQADTKEEKVSVALTTGIPLGLGMACSTYAIMKMVSGFNALGVGALTSLTASFIGKKLDKMYKKSHGIDENSKPSIPTIDLPIKVDKKYKKAKKV